MGTQWEHVPLVSSYHVSDLLLKQWRGPHYFMGYRYPWETMKQEPTDTVESAGPTVGHGAIVLASRLGFSTILLTGIDLCMNATGALPCAGHTRSRTAETAWQLRCAGYYLRRQSGWHFHRFLSKHRFTEQYWPSIQSELADTVFNLNIHAAEIPSIKYIDADQVTLPECKPDFDTSDYAPLDNASA